MKSFNQNIRGCLLFAVLFSGYLSAQVTGAFLKVADTKKSFGFVKQGKEVRVDFEFKNTGQAPLLINEVKVECSCTKAEYPKEPLAPGKEGKITLVVDTKTMQDRQDRIAEVISNASNGTVRLRYKGVVLRP
ncbi:MAG: DUF1573 domain-containing protein [Sediminibacterium sp.]|nr:DUF1573 domain-containing protein [Sediminibacterium sp.]